MFTEFDVLVCVILIAMMMFACYRGFVKDVLRALGFVGAALITLFFFPHTLYLLETHFESSLTLNIAAVLTIFLISLIIIMLLTNLLFKAFAGFSQSPVDRVLGLCFGFFKGFFIVAAIHFLIFFVNDYQDREEPEWLQRGQTYKLTKAGSNMFDARVGDYIRRRADEIREEQLTEMQSSPTEISLTPEQQQMIEERLTPEQQDLLRQYMDKEALPHE